MNREQIPSEPRNRLDAEVVRVRIERDELTAAAIPAIRELYGLDKLPLAESRVEIELKGVSTAVVNALRRAVTDEMPGRCLTVPPDGFDADLTTDVFMLPQFCNQRIGLLPLRPQIPVDVIKDLRLKLDVTNKGTSVMSVYSGDMEITAGAMPEPLFNPTFIVASLQPGKRIVIRDIHISAGYGRDNGAYLVARRAAFRHLDIPQHGEKETHDSGGAAADASGYKTSCLVADPRHHLLTAEIPATAGSPAEVRGVFADACANIKERLRLILTTVDRRPESRGPGGNSGVQFTVVQLEAGLTLGTLQVPGETHTIGELLRRAVFDLVPDISFVGYTIVTHENQMIFTIRHSGDVTKILMDAARYCVEVFDSIQRGLNKR